MKKFFFTILLIFIFLSGLSAGDFKKVGVILYSDSFSPAFQGFKDGLKELGYVENKNIKYFVNNINGNLSLVKPLLEKFKQSNANLIFTTTTFITLIIKKYINEYKIPVLFNEVGAPVISKVVDSFDKPGGYITGVSHAAYQLVPKRLEIFKDAFPYLENIIFFYNPFKKYIKNQLDSIISTAKSLKLNLLPEKVNNMKSMRKLIKNIKIPANSGIFMFPDAVVMANVGLLLKFSREKKLPLMVLDNIILRKGGCIGYSPSFYQIGVQTSFMAEKIFSGVFPGNIPVQMPLKIELSINIKEIEKLGLLNKFNKKYLIFADTVIK